MIHINLVLSIVASFVSPSAAMLMVSPPHESLKTDNLLI